MEIDEQKREQLARLARAVGEVIDGHMTVRDAGAKHGVDWQWVALGLNAGSGENKRRLEEFVEQGGDLAKSPE